MRLFSGIQKVTITLSTSTRFEFLKSILERRLTGASAVESTPAILSAKTLVTYGSSLT